jgi:ABC-type phosphate/phosphonate transport system substrate-binding protein
MGYEVNGMKCKFKVTLFCYFIFIACASKGAFAETQKVYIVGVVPQFEALRTFAIWQPILKELEKASGVKLKLQGSPSITDFEKKLMMGEFDFAYMNPYHMINAYQRLGYRPLLKDHSKQLQGILVVRKDASVNDIKQLNNKKIAFPDPNALGASLLIRVELKNNHNINFKPVYVGNHDSVYLNIIYKNVTAGGGVLKTLNHQKKAIREQLRVLYHTHKVASHPIGVHPRVDNSVAQRVQQAMLNLSQTEHGIKLLEKIPIKKMGSATIDEYMPLKDMDLEAFRVNINL